MQRHISSLLALCFFIVVVHIPPNHESLPPPTNTNVVNPTKSTATPPSPLSFKLTDDTPRDFEIEPFTPIPFGTHSIEMFETAAARLHYATTCEGSLTKEQMDITLVTQLGVERIENIPIICKQWGNHPMSAVVFLPFKSKKKAVEKVLSLAATLKETCPMLKLRAIKPDTPLPERDLPTNSLRNLAIEQVTTSHFVYVDGDFITSDNLHSNLLELISNPKLIESPNSVVIIPAYWMADACLKSPECSSKYEHGPTTHGTLKSCIAEGYCEPFLFSLNRFSHTTTRNALMFSEDPERLIEIPCFLSRSTEPFLLTPRCRVPDFIPCFSGYGKNKIQWIQHLHIMGYRFFQMTDGFMLHMPHAPSKAVLEYDPARQLAVGRMYQKFTDWLHETYDRSAEHTVPMCRGELQQGMTPTTEQLKYVEEDITAMYALVTPPEQRYQLVHPGHECRKGNATPVPGVKTLEDCFQRCDQNPRCSIVAMHLVEYQCYHLSSCSPVPKTSSFFRIFQKRN